MGIIGTKPKSRQRKEPDKPNTPGIKVVDNTPDKAKIQEKGPTTKEKTYAFKVLSTGDCGVGKSSITLRFTKSSFQDTPVESVGNDLLSKELTVDNTKCTLKIWDTAGQERFNTITSSFYRGANIIFICFDLTNKQSFDNVLQWLQEVDRFAAEDAQKLLVGTKCDLEGERMVNADDIQAFCSSHAITYVETSSKTAHNVDYAFQTACHEMLEAIKDGRANYGDDDM